MQSEKVLEKLQEYISHHRECNQYYKFKSMECNCGLDKLLEEIKKYRGK